MACGDAQRPVACFVCTRYQGQGFVMAPCPNTLRSGLANQIEGGGGLDPSLPNLTETNPQITQIAQIDPRETLKMSRIRDRWGARLVWACAGTAIRPEIIAALVASESGGNPGATNLEESILAMFHNILAGRPVRWKPLTQSQLKRLTDQQMRDYATSYGLTQITGYHVFPRDPRELLDPDTCLRETVVMLEDWLRRYALDPDKQAAELFHCWNGGGPHNRTVPGYVEHGMAHLRAYEALSDPQEPPASNPQVAHQEGAAGSGVPREMAPSPSHSEEQRVANSESGVGKSEEEKG